MSSEALVRRIPAIGAGAFPADASWSEAAALNLVRAQDGGVVTFATTVRLLDDGTALFARFDCDDADVWATHTLRDAPLWEEEVVEIFLAPGDDVPTGYIEVEVNPLGTLFDARVTNPDGRRDTMTVDPSWNSPGLVARVTRPAIGSWRAVIALPWSDACAGEPPAVWRANFFRIERPRSGSPEFSCWAPTLVDPPDFHKPSSFGRLLRAGPDNPR
jgi:hypothetical protein